MSASAYFRLPVTERSGFMLQQLTDSVRRLASGRGQSRAAPLVSVGDGAEHPVVAAQADISMLRGVTSAAADMSECVCPEPCERDHANE
jgi:hypothetical protein